MSSRSKFSERFPCLEERWVWEAKRNPRFRGGCSALAELLGGEPPESRPLYLPRPPYGPVILLPCDTGITGHRFPFRPACQLIEGIDRSRRTTLEPRRPVRVTQRPKVKQHRHAAPGIAGM